MKNFFLFFALLSAAATGSVAQAQVAPAETQAVTRQINQLMRNPKKPKQEVTLILNGCSGEQLIRDRGADVHTSQPLGLSFNSGNSGWAMKVDNGVFEMKMTFDWADVTTLTYEPATNDDKQKYFEIKIAKRKSGSNTSFELPLYTTDEAVVKDVMRRLEKIRQGCRK